VNKIYNITLQLNKNPFQVDESNPHYEHWKLDNPDDCIVEMEGYKSLGGTPFFNRIFVYPREYTKINPKGKHDGFALHTDKNLSLQDILNECFTGEAGFILLDNKEIVWCS